MPVKEKIKGYIFCLLSAYATILDAFEAMQLQILFLSVIHK